MFGRLVMSRNIPCQAQISRIRWGMFSKKFKNINSLTQAKMSQHCFVTLPNGKTYCLTSKFQMFDRQCLIIWQEPYKAAAYIMKDGVNLMSIVTLRTANPNRSSAKAVGKRCVLCASSQLKLKPQHVFLKGWSLFRHLTSESSLHKVYRNVLIVWIRYICWTMGWHFDTALLANMLCIRKTRRGSTMGRSSTRVEMLIKD